MPFDGSIVITIRAVFDSLKSALEEVKQSTKETAEAVKKNLGEAFDNFENKSSSTFKGLGDKLQELAPKFKEVGETLTTTVTVPLAALGGVAFASANDIEKAMDTIRAGTGATGKTLEELGNSLRATMQMVPVSAGDAATAIAELNTRFGLTGETLTMVTAQIAEFARMTNTDIATAVKGASDVFAAWGVSTQDMSSKLDFLWKVAQSTGISTSELFDVVSRAAPIFSQYGVSLEDAALMLASLDKAGIDSATALTGLRTAFANASKTAQEEGTSMENVLSEAFQRLQEGTLSLEETIQIFGNRAGAALYDASQKGTLNITELKNAIASSSETIMKASEDTRSFGEIMMQLKNKVELALEPLGVALLDAFNKLLPTIEKAIGFVAKLFEWFGNLPGPIQQTIVIIASLVAAIGPVLTMIGSMIETMQKLNSVFTILGAASSPIGLTIAIIGGLVALAAVIITNWEPIKKFFTDLWNNVKSVFENTINAIKNAVTGFVTNITKAFTDAGNAIENAIKTALTTIKEIFTGLWNGVKTGVESFANNIQTAFKNAKAQMTEAIQTAVDGVKNLLVTLWDKTKDGIQNFVSKFTSTFSDLKTTALDIVQKTIDGIKGVFAGLWDKVKDAVQGFADKVKNVFKDLWDKLVGHSIVPDTIDGIVSEFERLESEVLPTVDAVAQAIEDKLSTRLDKVATEVVPSAIAEVLSDFDTLNTEIKPVLESTAKQVDASFGLIKSTTTDAFDLSIQTVKDGVKTEQDLFTQLFEFLKDNAKTVQDVLTQTFKSGAQALVKFFDEVASGKKTFGDFKDALKQFLLDTLSGLEVQVLAAQAAGIATAIAQAPATLGASLGAIPGILGQTAATLAIFETLKAGVRAMAEGGIVTRPTLALVGEAGPEAVIPLKNAGALKNEVHLHIGTLIADEFGLLELQRRLEKVSVYNARR